MRRTAWKAWALSGFSACVIVALVSGCSGSSQSCSEKDAAQQKAIEQVWPESLVVVQHYGSACDPSGDQFELDSYPMGKSKVEKTARELQASGWKGSIDEGFTIRRHGHTFQAYFDESDGFLEMSIK